MPFYQANKNPRSGAGTGFYGALNRNNSNEPKGFYAAVNSPRKDGADLESVEGLVKLARQKGLLDDADEIAQQDRMSFLQRLSAGLGALNPAEAIARNYEGTESFLTAYPKTVLQGIASAFTGTDYGEQTKKRYFGELVKDLGIENKYARFGLGLVGDIFLDPSTYVGGAIVRTAAKGVGFTAKTALKGVGKVAPKVEEGLRMAGSGAKEALGDLFVYGYGASTKTTTGAARSLSADLLEFEGKKVNVHKALALSNAKRHGTDVLSDSQWEEFLGHIFKGKSAEFNFFDDQTDLLIEQFNKKFPGAHPIKAADDMKKALTEKLGREASDIEVRSAVRTQVTSRLESTARSIPVKIGKLQDIRQKLAQPFIGNDLMGLKSTVSELRKELTELTGSEVIKKTKGKPFMASLDQIDGALLDALSVEKNKYTKMIVDLEARIAGIEAGIIEPATRQIAKEAVDAGARANIDDIMKSVMRKLDPKLKIKDEIVRVTQEITKLTNEMGMKQHILNNALSGKQIAKERIARAFATGDFSTLPEELVRALKPAIDDPKIEKALMDRLARNKNLAEAAGIEDPFHMYAPSIAKDVTERQRITNFFNGTKGVKVGSKDYMKEFRNLLKDEDLLKDRSLFLRVEDEIATNKITEEFLADAVGNYGKPLGSFKSERDAAAAGFKIMKDKGIFGKEIGYVNDADWKFLNSQMGNNFKAFDAIAKATGFDAMTSLFKRFVTGIFAPFHVRNFASGEIQNFEILGAVAQMPKVQSAGMRLANKVSRGAYASLEDPFEIGLKIGKPVKTFGNETIELAGKTWKLDDIGAAIEKRFGGSSRYNVDFNSITSDAEKLMDGHAFGKEALKDWGKSFKSFSASKNPVKGLLGQDAPYFKGAQAIGAFIETQQKAKLVVGALQKGMGIEEALEIAAKGGFDYRALTSFESKIMRRIIPFYSFNRKNIELQLKVLGENPQRINQVIRGIENVQNLWETNLTPEEQKNLPAYLNEYLSAPVGRTSQGVPQFVRNFGTPIEAFTELVKFRAEGKSTIERTFLGMLSKVNPYIKVPVELGVGKDSFRQRDIKEVYTAPEYQDAPEFLKEFLKMQAVTKKDFATGLPRTVYVADPERLLVVRSLFTSRGFTYFNNVFNGNVTGFFKVMDLVSGIRVAEVDVERQAGFTDRRKMDELGDLLRRYGILSEFNKLFIPKGK